MAVQERISRARLAAKVGRTLEVMVDEAEGATVVARSHADAPEIDGVVRVRGARGARPGDMMRVRVTGAGEHDLQATIAA
jgi:ribosomal protein S12 methylthiotransferase